jgi:hypothetical protein
MNFVEFEAEQRDTPDTPVESENDLPLGSLDGSQHPDANTPDDSGTTNPAPTHEQQTPPTPTATAPPTATPSAAVMKAIRVVACAVRQGLALTATTTIVAGAHISFGITRTINYLFLRDEENRTDSFAFFGIVRKNPFTGMHYAHRSAPHDAINTVNSHGARTGANPSSVMPQMHTLDRRAHLNFYLEATNEPTFDPDGHFDKDVITRIVDDTTDRHNREAPVNNVDTLTKNASNALRIAITNMTE